MPQRNRSPLPQVVALAIGGAAGALGLGVGVPATALIASTFAVAVAATLRCPLEVHPRLRDLAFAVIGISLGVEPDALGQLRAWSVSLVLLLASLATTLLAGAVLLERVLGKDWTTAILAASPGTMSNAIALALEGRGNATEILILQTIRLLVLVTIVPPMAMIIGANTGFTPAAPMELVPLALPVVAALALGLVGARAGIPAACLLVGMILSAVAHVAGFAQGPAPEWVVNASFVVAGTALGARLAAVSASQLLRLSREGLFLVVLAVIVSLCFAGLTHAVTGLPLAQVWIAFAPGGVEAMAAIGLALGYDPAYEAIHHFARILALVIAIPFILSRYS